MPGIDPEGRRLPSYDTSEKSGGIDTPITSLHLEHPDPHFKTYGPKTRREFLRGFQSAG